VELEVKARTGWASFRSTGAQGVALLENLHGKVTLRPTRAFLGLIVALPGRAGKRRKRAKIVIADPGEAVALDEQKQTELLLDQAISLLYQHGLWPSLARALAWLRELRELTEHEIELSELVDRYADVNQYTIVRREHDSRQFNGRIFNDVIARLGQVERRGMQREEAEQRLHLNDFGHAWYSGADEDFVRIIEERDDQQLRKFGVRGEGSRRDLGGRSAFHVAEEPMTQDLRDAVRNLLQLALRRW
jgi:hypothetical protein